MSQQSNLRRDRALFDVGIKHIIRIDHADVVSEDQVQVVTLALSVVKVAVRGAGDCRTTRRQIRR